MMTHTLRACTRTICNRFLSLVGERDGNDIWQKYLWLADLTGLEQIVVCSHYDLSEVFMSLDTHGKYRLQMCWLFTF